ncbi:MAG: alanine racemase [Chloroflexi bacterium]|nr:alanine racemase [Chloroflexota bacterium]
MAQARTQPSAPPVLEGREAPWPCWIDVDLDAIEANVRGLRAWIGPRVRLFAVVKAHAYGLGSEQVAKTVLAAGADGLAVARVREGIRLRRYGVRAPILLLTAFAPSEALALARHGLTPTVTLPEQVPLLIEAAQQVGVRLPVHVKVDTGLHRYGAGRDEALALALAVARSPHLRLEGFYTHFATADALDLTFAREQLATFRAACDELARQGVRPPVLHAANSAGTLALPEAHADLVRVGLAVYGYRATQAVPTPFPLQPAVTLWARIARLLDLPAGCTVGYGRTYRTTRPMRAALLTIGYADGLPGSHYRGGYVLLHGQRADLIGRISMDQCVVDITHCPQTRVGDCAVVLGQQGDDLIALDEFAERSGSIPHEALTSLGARVPRLYWRGGQVVASASLAAEERVDGDL